MIKQTSTNLPFPLFSPLFSNACKIIEKLQKKQFEAYLVGGSVRDILLGKEPKDYDIATNAKPEEVMALFKRTIPVGVAFGVVTVVIDEYNYEVATFRAEADYTDGRRPNSVAFASAEADAIRRDFTINALFYDPIQHQLIDFTGGLEDLNHGLIRAIGNPFERFSEDYLRMLRAVRFSARFNFPLEFSTFEAIQANAHHITSISRERIYHELTSMWTGPNPEIALDLLLNTNLLEHTLPQLLPTINCAQPVQYHPEGDVWTHTRLLLSNLPSKPDPILAWAALLHDIAKPDTLIFKEDGTPATPGHARAGAIKAEEILRNLRAPNKLIETVSHLVDNHMRMGDAMLMKKAKLRRLLSENDFSLALELHRIDCLSGSGQLHNYHFLISELEQLTADGAFTQLPPPLINGNQLIKMGLKPSPIFASILHQALDAQLEGEIKTPEEAQIWLENHLKKSSL